MQHDQDSPNMMKYEVPCFHQALHVRLCMHICHRPSIMPDESELVNRENIFKYLLSNIRIKSAIVCISDLDIPSVRGAITYRMDLHCLL
mgnify:CR=1 FL=1